ncbi:hypothetical protein SALBM135S_00754 [Streptomyces alboniger]
MAKGRKNRLYPGISEELSALMLRTGWADTERHDLTPAEQAPYAARRRAALSARFPADAGDPLGATSRSVRTTTPTRSVPTPATCT